MIATSGRVTALAVGIPLAFGAVGWQAFNLVGFMAQTSEHHEASYPWHGGELTVDVSSGSVRVVVGGDSSVDVAYIEHYQLKKPTVSVSATDTGLAVTARCPGGLLSNNCDVNYTLTVPSSAKLTMHSGDGGLHVSGLTSALSLDTGDGGIWLDNVSGDVQARTGDGGLHGANLRSNAFTAHTGDGGSNLAWATVPKDVAITSGNGGVHVTVPDGSGPYLVDVASGNGRTQVSVATDPKATSSVTVRTGNGGVSVGYGP